MIATPPPLPPEPLKPIDTALWPGLLNIVTTPAPSGRAEAAALALALAQAGVRLLGVVQPPLSHESLGDICDARGIELTYGNRLDRDLCEALLGRLLSGERVALLGPDAPAVAAELLGSMGMPQQRAAELVGP